MSTTTRIALVALALSTLPGCLVLLDGTEYLGRAHDAGSMDAHVPRDASTPPIDAAADSTSPNVPPVLTTVALDRYDPIVGEVLRAYPGPVIDPDGPEAMIRFTWLRNDVPLEGASSASLDTSSFVAGDAITLEARADDGRQVSEPVRVGPVTVLASTTRWRQLLPDGFGAELPAVVYDAPHRRFVRYVRGALWEYRTDGATVHTTRLATDGTAPPSPGPIAPLVLHDEASRRLIVFADSLNEAFVADLSVRGAEQWTRVAMAGEPPAFRVAPALAFDPSGPRIWMYGGASDLSFTAIASDLWSLELSSGTWEHHALVSAVPPLVGAAFAMLPGNDRALLVGGTDFVSGTSTASFVLGLDRDEVGVEPGPALEVGVAFAAACGTDTGAIVAGGGSSVGPGATAGPVLRYDVERGAFVASDGPSELGGGGVIARDPDDATRLVWWPGALVFGEERGGFEWRAITHSSGATTLLAAETRPGPLQEALASSVDASTWMMVGGRNPGVSSPDGVWRYDGVTERWTREEIAPDAVTGRAVTEGAWGVVAASGRIDRFGPATVLYAGGESSSGALPLDVFELDLLSAQWIDHSSAAGSVEPPARHAHLVAPGLCGAMTALVFGGLDAARRPLGDAWRLSCTTRRECTWEELPTDGAPSARSHAAWARADARYIVFGGLRDAASASDEVFDFSPCESGTWRAPAVVGTAPSARFGHSIVSMHDGSSEPTRLLVFGGAGRASDVVYPDDAYRLEVVSRGEVRWERLSPEGPSPGGRIHHVAAWDAGRARMLVYGGRDPQLTRGDLWELRIR